MNKFKKKKIQFKSQFSSFDLCFRAQSLFHSHIVEVCARYLGKVSLLRIQSFLFLTFSFLGFLFHFLAAMVVPNCTLWFFKTEKFSVSAPSISPSNHLSQLIPRLKPIKVEKSIMVFSPLLYNSSKIHLLVFHFLVS